MKHRRPSTGGPVRAPKPISGALDSLIGSLGIADSYHGWMVVTKWPEMFAGPIARRAHAFKYDSGTLFVAVEDAAWRQNLSMETEAMLEKIHSYPFGRVVKTLRLVRSEKGI
ncbi:MAG: DUF721 domain-containing protein [Candidatus Zixiibacteriota bacterium]